MASVIQVWNMALGRLEPNMSVSSTSEQSTRAQTLRTYYDQARQSLLAEYDWNFAKVVYPALPLTGNAAPSPWSTEYARPPCIKVRSIVPATVLNTGQDTIISGTASSIDFGGQGVNGYIGGPQFQGGSQPLTGSVPSPTVIPFDTGAVLASVANVAALQGQGVSGLTPGAALPVIWTNITLAGAFCTVDVPDPSAWEPGFLNVMSWHLAAEICMSITSSASMYSGLLQGKNNAMQKAMNTEGNEGTVIASWDADWISGRAPAGFNGWGYGYGDGY